ncbi:MAG: magnesium transporter [Planctomycetota bacterium]|jgi:magnesium transporter
MSEERDQQEMPAPGEETAEPRLEDVADPSPTDERVAQLLTHTIDVPVLASAVDQQLAADAADTLETLEEAEAVELLEQMEDERAAGALSEMQKPLAATVLADLVEDKPDYAGRLLELMAPDDATDLLQSLDEAPRRRLLEVMPHEEARELVELLHYDEESAGGMMTTDLLTLREGMTVEQAIDYIRATAVPEGTQRAFVLDDDDRLLGAIGLRRLLLAQPADLIADLMRKSVRVVKPDMDREEVAREFDRYDYATLAVVDDAGRLLGMVTVDDVIDIIRAEQTEDVQKTVGAGAGEAVFSTVTEKLRGRLPWLTFSLLLTCAVAAVVLLGESLIREYPLLPFLLVVIAPLVGNAGHQALAVTLRGIVLDEVRPERVWPLVAREATVGICNGLVIGGLLLGFVWILTRVAGVPATNVRLGFVASVAMTLAMGVGTLAGSGIPLLMRRLGADPAHASAIILIVITDGVSFACLIGLALVLL